MGNMARDKTWFEHIIYVLGDTGVDISILGTSDSFSSCKANIFIHTETACLPSLRS